MVKGVWKKRILREPNGSSVSTKSTRDLVNGHYVKLVQENAGCSLTHKHFPYQPCCSKSALWLRRPDHFLISFV
jgi:hypothetical protein